MTNLPSVSESYIRSLASDRSFERGNRYYRNGSIVDIILRGSSIRAKVQGSDYYPYDVNITLDEKHLVVQASCACPFDWGGICKHVVAVLMTIALEPQTVVEKPKLEALLADLKAEQLRQLLIGLADIEPGLVDDIEKELKWLPDQASVAEDKGHSLSQLINSTRREIDKGFRWAGKVVSHKYDYYDEYAGLEIDIYESIGPHLGKVFESLEKEEFQSAEMLISAIIDAFIEGLTDLDDNLYEYNVDAIDDAITQLDAVTAEVLLSQDLNDDQKKEWLEKIAEWEKGLGELAITRTAIEQGWSYPPLVAAMQGKITEKGAWEGDIPDFADDLARARLHILERQNRTQEYINLAEAEGEIRAAIYMLARSGQIEKTVSYAKKYMVYPGEILSLLKILEQKDQMDAALEIAQFGLSLEYPGKEQLALWVREQIGNIKKQPLALNAAVQVFSNTYELTDYLAVRQLAGDEWQTVKAQLLEQLQNCWEITKKIEIYLFENKIEEARQALDEEEGLLYRDLERVIEISKGFYPDWCIQKCKARAEGIMNSGESRNYDTAVYWLVIARDIYQQHDRQKEWEAYLVSLLEIHQRKYKLVPMLDNIQQKSKSDS